MTLVGPAQPILTRHLETTPTIRFRPGEGVDASNGLVTNHIFDGEWLEYTTDIQPGSYDISLNKAWSAGETTVSLLVALENSAKDFRYDRLVHIRRRDRLSHAVGSRLVALCR